MRQRSSLAPGGGTAALGQSQRLWGTLALQSIFMHTSAGMMVDVVTLTNSVLGGRVAVLEVPDAK